MMEAGTRAARRRRALALLTALAAPLADAEAAEAPLPPVLEDRVFEVRVDDRDVGAHRFRFEGDPADFRVHSAADFEVKISFVTVFSYEHRAEEHWVDGCLVSLDSKTDGREDFEVHGERTGGGFSIETLEGGQTLDLPCPWGFAYWNPAMRERARLVNPQDGRLFEIESRELDPRPLSVGDRSVRARAWSLTGSGEKLDLTLYYDEQDHWIGLDSTVEGGRVLRYRPHRDDPFYPD
jgi:hypothetical protein